MKFIYFLSLFLFGIVSLLISAKDCELHGVYKIEYEKSQYSELISKIEFSDSSYLKTFELGKVKGIITKLKDRNGKCIFYLTDKPEKVDSIKLSQIDDSSSLVKELRMGNPVMEIAEPFGDTIEFKIVLSGQLHVIIRKGKLIKL